nr:hypothetical protein CFP56_05131 [Quercus suber]
MKYTGGKMKVYDNVDSDYFSVPEVKHYCAELGVLDYVQFYFLVLGLDLHNGLRYLSIDANTQELFKCLDPINPKIDIYVKHAASVQKQLLVRDVSVVDVANLENDNLVDEGNAARGNDVNGAVGDVDYEWHGFGCERPWMAIDSKEHFMGFRVQVDDAFSSQLSNAANIEGNSKRFRARVDGSQRSCKNFNSQQNSRT